MELDAELQMGGLGSGTSPTRQRRRPRCSCYLELWTSPPSARRDARRPRGAMYMQGRWPMGRLPGDACRDGDGREAEASLRKLGFHFVHAPIELEGHRSVKLLLIWASFSTEWAANSWN